MTKDWSNGMSDWCPENDGAYRAELAAMYPAVNRKRIKALEDERDALQAKLEATVEAQARAEKKGGSDDLVKRARDQQTKWMTPLLGQMADRIEELAAALEKQKGYKEDYKIVFTEAIGQVEALEARVAAAVKLSEAAKQLVALDADDGKVIVSLERFKNVHRALAAMER